MPDLGIEDAIRGLCLALPDVEAFLSHGMPNFRRRKGKVFAILALNHHGDGRIALWLNTPPALQFDVVEESSTHFFIPRYVGPSGWLGVRLDSGLSWKRVSELVRQAYEHTVKHRGASLPTPVVPGPSRRPTLADVDPMFAPAAQRAVAAMRELCLALPETSEATQFGKPVWRAGKKVFAQCFAYRDAPVKAAFWVGVDRQGLMTMDRRFSIPAYLGPGGWIALDVEAGFDVGELRGLALESYRHFALARMLKALPDAVNSGPAVHTTRAVPAARGRAPRVRQATRKPSRRVR
jgi:predicted DNA-binding protein (MmcQ/YjbR family)